MLKSLASSAIYEVGAMVLFLNLMGNSFMTLLYIPGMQRMI